PSRSRSSWSSRTGPCPATPPGRSSRTFSGETARCPSRKALSEPGGAMNAALLAVLVFALFAVGYRTYG
ncbi:MAG: hypothetical protein GWN46_07675, partial [Gammaproteobacteria bacterium]|nr:hypothetical protein [Gammaproteobacteria bacterium]